MTTNQKEEKERFCLKTLVQGKRTTGHTTFKHVFDSLGKNDNQLKTGKSVISETQTKIVVLLRTQQLKMTSNQKQEKERFSPKNVGSG